MGESRAKEGQRRGRDAGTHGGLVAKHLGILESLHAVEGKQEKPTSASAVWMAKGREEGRGGPRQIRAEERAALLQPETGVQARHSR